MDLCLTSRFMDAAEAERAGLVSRVVAADKLIEEALSAAETIASFSLPVVMMIKESVNRAFEGSLSEGLLFERRVFHSAFALNDQKGRHGGLCRKAQGQVQPRLSPPLLQRMKRPPEGGRFTLQLAISRTKARSP